MAKTLWFFADGVWQKVATSDIVDLISGGDGGILFDTTDSATQEGGYLQVTANGTGGITALATGSGTGFAAGQMLLECNGGTTWLKNSDEGVVIYGTGHFSTGRITDKDTALLETGADRPSLILAGSNGVVISSSAIDAGDETGAFSVVFLFADTGNNLFRSPAIHAKTSDPGIPGALWNDSGTVKISL